MGTGSSRNMFVFYGGFPDPVPVLELFVKISLIYNRYFMHLLYHRGRKIPQLNISNNKFSAQNTSFSNPQSGIDISGHILVM